MKCWDVEYPTIPLADMRTGKFDSPVALIVRGKLI